MNHFAALLICCCLFCFTPPARAAGSAVPEPHYSVCDVQPAQVVLVPLDDFPADLAVGLARALSDDLKICVRSSLAMGSRGLVPFTGTDQYPAEDMVQSSTEVISHLPDTGPKTCYVLLTGRDINERARNFRFLFAWHDRHKRVSVVSLARMLSTSEGGRAGDETIISRIYKMTKRSIGEQYFGFSRSTDLGDVMYSPIMGLDNLDAMGTRYAQMRDAASFRDSTDTLLRNSVDLLLQGDMDGLRPLILLPDRYSLREREDELNGIVGVLALLSREFGSAGRLQTVTEPGRLLEFVVTGGSSEFLRQHARYAQVAYRCDFAKVGQGFILLQVAEDSRGEPKLRGVGFALDADQSNAARASDLARKVQQYLEQKRTTISL